MSVWLKNKQRLSSLGAIILGLVIFTLVVKLSIKPTNRPQQVVPSPTTMQAIISRAACHAIQENQQDPQSFLPDPFCTPGALNPQVTQATIFQTICVLGYEKTIRPSVGYTEPLKIQSIRDYGYADTNPGSYEEDHLIPLELGGSPTDPKNLWAEPHASLNEKDRVEAYLHAQVCAKRMNLAEAQREISTNWYQALKIAGL